MCPWLEARPETANIPAWLRRRVVRGSRNVSAACQSPVRAYSLGAYGIHIGNGASWRTSSTTARWAAFAAAWHRGRPRPAAGAAAVLTRSLDNRTDWRMTTLSPGAHSRPTRSPRLDRRRCVVKDTGLED